MKVRLKDSVSDDYKYVYRGVVYDAQYTDLGNCYILFENGQLVNTHKYPVRDFEIVGEPPERKTTLPQDSAKRKEIPLYDGVIAYFPAALAGVARVSKVGNDKHNPGEPLHHARGKSMDHLNCVIRHLIDAQEGDGMDATGVPHIYKAC